MTAPDEPAVDDHFRLASLVGLTAEAPPGEQVRRRLSQASAVRARSPGPPPQRRGSGASADGRRRRSPRRTFRWPAVLTALGGWPRRALALGCLLAAVAAALHRPAASGAAGAPPGVPVLVAARDLAAGAALAPADVRVAAIPVDLVPAGAIRSLGAITGRVAAGPLRRGEPLTDARLLGRGLTAGLSPPESVAVPVRLADGQTAALVRPGDRVDLLATVVDAGPALGAPGADPAGASPAVPTGGAGAAARPRDATVLATAVRVLAVLADARTSPADGVLVVVATSDRVARQLAAAAAQQRLSVALRPP
ncbi:MAG: pilus assembly protein CpaB [Mycobacteriales bacterium]